MAANFYVQAPQAIENALAKCLIEAGHERTETLSDADFAFTYYPLLSQLEDAYFDAQGYLAQAKKGAYLVDLSPATPELTREISAIASVSDLHFVEAPVAVNDVTLPDAFALPENLWCAVAGDKPDVQAARAVLQHFAGSVRVFDEVGAAQAAHAAWTLQQVPQIFAAVESEALYRALLRVPTSAAAAAGGVPVFAEGGTGVQASVVQALSEQRFAGTYTVEMLMADLSAALTLTSALDLTLPQAETCMSLLETLAIIGGSDLSPAALAVIYDEEEAAAAQGLDWARSQEYINELGAHEHEHHHGHSAAHGHAEEGGDSAFGGFDAYDDLDVFDDDAVLDDDLWDAAPGDPHNSDAFGLADSGDDSDDDFGGYADLLKGSANN